jgi:hypothetical protein
VPRSRLDGRATSVTDAAIADRSGGVGHGLGHGRDAGRILLGEQSLEELGHLGSNSATAC